MRENKAAGTVMLAVFFAFATAILVAVGVGAADSWLSDGGNLEPVSRSSWVTDALPRMAWASFSRARACHDLCQRRVLSSSPMGLAPGDCDFRDQRARRCRATRHRSQLEGVTGVIAAGAILFYLSRPKVRDAFA